MKRFNEFICSLRVGACFDNCLISLLQAGAHFAEKNLCCIAFSDGDFLDTAHIPRQKERTFSAYVQRRTAHCGRCQN
jgi:hypothetical protein